MYINDGKESNKTTKDVEINSDCFLELSERLEISNIIGNPINI